MDWASLLVGMQQAQNQPRQLAPIPAAPPTSPFVWALFGVGAVAAVGFLVYVSRQP